MIALTRATVFAALLVLAMVSLAPAAHGEEMVSALYVMQCAARQRPSPRMACDAATSSLL